MKNIAFLLIATVALLVACQPENLLDDDCLALHDYPGWVTEDFKNGYDIQLPATYQGHGMVGFEGNFFSRYSPDSSIMLSYNYCGPLYCEDYGDTLVAPLANAINVPDGQGNNLLSQHVQTFCEAGVDKGVFYYTADMTAGYGLYFMGDRNVEVYEALYVRYAAGELPTVFDILATIQAD